jgi:protein-tyrosine phosphatase
MLPNIFRIPVPAAGTLATMPRPRGGDWLDDEMAALAETGVGVLVCLLTAPELRELELVDEGPAAERAGMRFHHFPIEDFGVPDHAQLTPLVDALIEDLRAGSGVIVHCRGGIGRSSVVAGSVLVRLGVDPDEAWATISAARGVPVPETEEQLRFLSGGGGSIEA